MGFAVGAGAKDHSTTHVFQTRTGASLGAFCAFGRIPLEYITVGPSGHYFSPDSFDEDIIYVALTEDGRQEMYSPAQFEEKFGWVNDPDKLNFMQLGE